ncbi:hypothetical protein JRO89_XS11G0118600 [Xanthoceras sorbifolium]|uniref:Protein POLYCHOME n=1 Tax=Xanthoceras sorbifolium TaxID=99658 RepID=A0ABQ8HFA9_9ROSI|nr:hypothetical protein JRO89_XS11G0118600 [Xanthoceras sorbifolium]
MPEARDRLVRPVDIAANFARRRSGALGVFQDEPEASTELVASPQARVATMTPRGRMRDAGRGGSGFGTPRGGFGRGRRSTFGSASATRGSIGRENTPVLGSARRGRSVLPAWYPRTPLRDVTAVVRRFQWLAIESKYNAFVLEYQAIERRRARLGAVEGHQIDIPMSQDQRELDSSLPLLGAQPGHDASLMSPKPASSIKHCPPSVGKVPKILLNITNQVGEGSEFLTPQKKLLNSIDKVEKVVMEELKKLKRTPSAKKAEREKRVRTLMSMR